MAFSYRLEDYVRYRQQVGEATCVDISRRTDPARVARVWENLQEIYDACGAPWIVQILTKDVSGTLRLGEGLLRKLIEAGSTVTAQVTITGLAGTIWEPLVPTDGIQHLSRLAAVLGGPEHVKWRYDPIIPTVHDERRFRDLAQRVADTGVRLGVINFVAPPGRYNRVDRRLSQLLPGWSSGMTDYDMAWRKRIASELVEEAARVGIRLSCCAECHHLASEIEGLGRAACGDHSWFTALSGRITMPRAPYKGSRPGCGCARYYDVGSYGHWSKCHRCAYCYAG